MDTLPYELHLQIFVALARSSAFSDVQHLAQVSRRLQNIYTTNSKTLLATHLISQQDEQSLTLHALASVLPRGTYSWSSKALLNAAEEANTEAIIRGGIWNLVAEMLSNPVSLTPTSMSEPQLRQILQISGQVRGIVREAEKRHAEFRPPSPGGGQDGLNATTLLLELLHHNRCLKSHLPTLLTLTPHLSSPSISHLHTSRGHLLTALMQHPDMFSIQLELKARLGLRVDRLRIALMIREWADVGALWEFFCRGEGRERVALVLGVMPMRAVVGGDVRFMVGI